jgi:hypothetical protein
LEHSRTTTAEGLGNQIDGLGGSSGDTHFPTPHPQQGRQLRLQSLRTWLGIRGDIVEMVGKIAQQILMIQMLIDIGTEIQSNVAVIHEVVAMTLEHEL